MASTVLLEPGTLLDGRYSLRRLIATGGMANVYEADDTVLSDVVAIKVMHDDLRHDPAARARFFHEAALLGAVAHEYLVRLLHASCDDAKSPYLVFERIEGTTLAEALVEQAFEVQRSCVAAEGVLSALSALHRGGVVHRDIKPDNVMLVVDEGGESVKLLDLGAAVCADVSCPSCSDRTPAGVVMGTPEYSSPEQVSGRELRDERTDIHAVGVLLYTMLAGERPFRGRSLAELCDQIANHPPPPIRVFRRGVPSDLEQIVRRALAKVPSERYPSANAMQAALRSFRSSAAIL